MPSFGPRSTRELATCHPYIQVVMNRVIKHIDLSILEGHRGKPAQEVAFSSQRSTLHFPESKHNSEPSMAVDVARWPIDWDDKNRFFIMAGYILMCAKDIANEYEEFKDFDLRWGGDWNRNGVYTDQTFFDLPHFEIIRDRSAVA